MTVHGFAFALEVEGPDGRVVDRVPIVPDFEPAREDLRLRAVEAGGDPATAFRIDPRIEPRWSETRGPPYVGSFRLSAPGSAVDPLDIGTEYFAHAANQAGQRLVRQGRLTKGEKFVCRLLGRRQPEQGRAASFGVSGKVRIPVGGGTLQTLVDRAVDHADDDADASDPPLFIPDSVLAAAIELTHAARSRETGGILVGHLRRDAARRRLYVVVTGQIPARHTESEPSKLTFTPDTWADVHTVLATRPGEELMLGWWHSHPIREWCKQCPEERQRVCHYADGFLSEHDRHLHRTVFQRAFSVALVVNDVAFGPPTISAFGWRRGLIARRSFHSLQPVGGTPSAT